MASTYFAGSRFLSRLRGKAVLLTYHRVLSEEDLAGHYVQPGMYVLRDVFERQMRFVKGHFQVLPLSRLIGMWESGRWDDGTRYCVITFDDGWRDNYLHAYPLLKDYGIPATIFLPTAFIGTNRWFWQDRLGYLLKHSYDAGRARKSTGNAASLLARTPVLSGGNGRSSGEQVDSAIERCKILSRQEIEELINGLEEALGMKVPEGRMLLDWDEIREMSDSGISFGSHSATHRILTMLTADEVRDEVEGSFRALREREINHSPVFCYPNGNRNREIERQVKEAGYRAAVGVSAGFEGRRPGDLFGLRRINIHNDITSTTSLFLWHLSGMNSVFAFPKRH